MNELGTALASRGEDALDVEVGLARGRGAETHGGVGLAYERQRRIGIRIRGHCAEAEAARGAEDAPRDLAAVRYQNNGHVSQRALRRSKKARMPSCPSGLTRSAAMRSTVSARISATGRPATSRTRRFAACTAFGPPATTASRYM